MTTRPEEPGPNEGMGAIATSAAGCAMVVMVVGGWLWLWARGKLDLIPERAVGSFGPWTSLGVGTAVGFALAGAFLLLGRYLTPMQRLETRLRKLFGPLDEGKVLALGLLSAVGEEFLFRLAALDAIGLVWAALLYAGFNIGPGLRIWTLLSFIMGLLFGSMVWAGFGLLSATVAHAIANYLTLRRILTP